MPMASEIQGSDDRSAEVGLQAKSTPPNPFGTQAPASVLVLGMHRSGTSAVTGLLGMSGLDLGDTAALLPAHVTDNPSGYWERADLNAINDDALATIGRAWNRVAGLDADSVSSAADSDADVRIEAFIARFEAKDRPCVIKDPRLCLTLPRWLPRLKNPVCVVVVRDPREVAASMASGPRGTFTSSFVVALWTKYMHAALEALHGRRAVFVSYHALLGDALGQSERIVRCLRELGVRDIHTPDKAQVSAFIDRTQHRSEPQAHVALSPEQSRLYDWLSAQCGLDHPVAVDNFPAPTQNDAILREFEAAFDFHVEHGRANAIVDVGGLSGEFAGDIARPLQEIGRLLAEHYRERDQWRAHQKALVADVRDARARLHRTLDDNESLRRDRDAALENLRERTADMERTRAEIDRLSQQFGAGMSLEERFATLDAQTKGLQETVDALRSSLSWKLTAPLRAIGTLRPSFKFENALYRLYYSMPGFGPARKRAAVLWVHRHMPALTRHTLSYRLFRQAEELGKQKATSHEERQRLQRMDEAGARARIDAIADPPLISIVMPVYDVEPHWLMAAVESVRRQFYPHWELCIADDASRNAATRAALDDIERWGDARIKIARLPKNGGIAAASNAALQMATGEYVGLLDNDDELTRDALVEIADRARNTNADIVYSDEDKIDPSGVHVEPHFKPDFAPDYLFCNNYICHFAVFRKTLLDDIGGFRGGFEGAQDFDLLLRATEKTQRVEHIPKVLYHWRKTDNSTATSSVMKPKASQAGVRALGESLKRRGIDATPDHGPFPTTYRVRRRIEGTPLVSILIPFRDKPDLLRTCIDSILDKTEYANYEIVGIDNGSIEEATHSLMRSLTARDARVRFVRYDAPFNYSAINNFGARQVKGEYLLLLNNDTEVIARGWLGAMLEYAQRPDVGVVGAKLLYTDKRIQHAGVIVGIGGVAGHAHLMERGDEPGYFSRAQLPQNLSAVTFACAMVRKSVFEELGGLNERELTIAFNDIDFCLRAREAGYLVVYTPYAELFHHESRSRGYEDNAEKQARFSLEIQYMQTRHQQVLERGDPYYNPNLSLKNNFQFDPRFADYFPL
jgi:GT2 family glycosyltransferase